MSSYRPITPFMMCLADLLRDPEMVSVRIDGRSLIVRSGVGGTDKLEFFVPEEDGDEA